MAGKILVLDDEENYASMLRDLLVQEGFRADMVIRPHDALKALDSEEYALVIADYKMPVMDGADFMERARARLPNLPIIMVSGLMNTPELVKVANMDVTLVLEKPLDIKVFLSYVRRFAEPLSKEERAAAASGEAAPAPKPATRTYPALAHLADVTESARDFVQQLWEASREGRYVFIGVPPGGETELVTCELSDWYGFPGLPIHQFSVSQIESLDVLQTIREIPGQNQVSKLVAITDFGEATPAQIVLFQKLIAADPKLLDNGREVCWVFYLDITRYPQSLPDNGPDMFEIVKNHLLVLPPLHDRLADLSTYFKLHLDMFAKRESDPDRALLSPGAVAALLSHDWPGNYDEVVETARRIATGTHAVPLTAEDAVAILGENAGVGGGLEAYLVRKQREFIVETARRCGIKPLEVLQNLKITPGGPPVSEDLSNLGLLLPDLLPKN